MKQILFIMLLSLCSCARRSIVYTDMSTLLNESKGYAIVTAVGYNEKEHKYEAIICDEYSTCRKFEGINYKLSVNDTLIVKIPQN